MISIDNRINQKRPMQAKTYSTHWAASLEATEANALATGALLLAKQIKHVRIETESATAVSKLLGMAAWRGSALSEAPPPALSMTAGSPSPASSSDSSSWPVSETPHASTSSSTSSSSPISALARNATNKIKHVCRSRKPSQIMAAKQEFRRPRSVEFPAWPPEFRAVVGDCPELEYGYPSGAATGGSGGAAAFEIRAVPRIRSGTPAAKPEIQTGPGRAYSGPRLRCAYDSFSKP